MYCVIVPSSMYCYGFKAGTGLLVLGLSLHSMCSTLSPREVYATKCNAHRCNKNSQLMKLLPDSHQWDLLTELELNLNFVGRVGIRPVLEVWLQ